MQSNYFDLFLSVMNQQNERKSTTNFTIFAMNLLHDHDQAVKLLIILQKK